MIRHIPGDVPPHMRAKFIQQYTVVTKGTNNLFVFSADHKIEHLDKDFHGPHIPHEAHHPKHLFKIAQQSPIGAFASQLGLIARYGPAFPEITYLIKLNSKTSLMSSAHKDPLSRVLWSVEDVITFKKSSGLPIAGIGITVYLGSAYEDVMLSQAAQAVFQAHQHGLITIIWMYPRGSSIVDETDAELLAGAAGVAACLGADFVKIHAPTASQGITRSHQLQRIVEAAGNTRVILAGGSFQNKEHLLTTLKKDIEESHIAGAAIGRSIFQHTKNEAIALCKELAHCVYNNHT